MNEHPYIFIALTSCLAVSICLLFLLGILATDGGPLSPTP